MIKIAICDDESFYREQLLDIVTASFDFIEVKSFSSGEEFLSEVEFDFDIILLDIEMSGINGIEVACQLQLKQCKSLIIFVTSHTDCITQAMQTEPFQYILKPFDDKNIIQQVSRSIEKTKKRKNKIFVKWNGIESFVNIVEVEYIENNNRKLMIHCNDNIVHLSVGKMADIYNKLIEYDFIRVHNSFIVNMESIIKIHANIIQLKSGSSIIISKQYIHDVKEKFRVFVSGVII